MNIAGLSDTGRVRPHNEDAWDIESAPGLWLLSDGVGGLAAGEVASRLAIETAAQHWRDREAPRGPVALLEALHTTVQAAHQAVKEAATGADREGMGATLLAAVVRDGYYYLAHVGDSRAYLMRDGRLQQLTHDHTVAQVMVNQGLARAGEAEEAAGGGALSQAIGHREVEVDLYRGRWEPSDILLLCSDGLYDMLPDARIAELLRRYGSDPQAACRELVKAANQAGGRDNITVILAAGSAHPAFLHAETDPIDRPEAHPLPVSHVDQTDLAPPPYPSPSPAVPRLWLAIAVAAVVTGILFFAIGRRLTSRWTLDLQATPPVARNGLPGALPGSRVPLPALDLDAMDELANRCGLGDDYADVRERTYRSAEEARRALLAMASRLLETSPVAAAGDQTAAARLRELADRLAESLKTGDLSRGGGPPSSGMSLNGEEPGQGAGPGAATPADRPVGDEEGAGAKRNSGGE